MKNAQTLKWKTYEDKSFKMDVSAVKLMEISHKYNVVKIFCEISVQGRLTRLANKLVFSL